jgi:two-component system, OmpR family, sensor histidine kinase SenX3
VNNGNTKQTAQVAVEVLEALSTAAVVVDDSNVMVQATTAAEEFGLQADRALIELELLTLVDSARTSKTSRQVEGAINVGGRAAKVWVLATAAPLGRGFVILTLEDRTEARRLDETRRDFVANISHELKTPIGAIGLLAETLQGATDDPEAVLKFASSLQREASRLGHIVQEIIELSRLQAATEVKNSTEIRLADLISDSLERVRILAESKNMRLVADLDDSILIEVSYEQIATAITNLFENAINYSDPGGQVGISLKRVDNFAEIVVTDSGVGIALEDQARIFERFYRVDPSRSRETGGTGLGLAIVKHIAINHGGEILVFSKPGLGSTFTLTLPITPSSEEIE